MVVTGPNMVVFEGSGMSAVLSGGVVGAKRCVALGLDIVEADVNLGIISVVILDPPVVSFISVLIVVTLTDDTVVAPCKGLGVFCVRESIVVEIIFSIVPGADVVEAVPTAVTEGLMVVFCPVVVATSSVGVSNSVDMGVIVVVVFSVGISPEVIAETVIPVGEDSVVTCNSFVAVLSAPVGRIPLVVVCSKRGVAVKSVFCVVLAIKGEVVATFSLVRDIIVDSKAAVLVI